MSRTQRVVYALLGSGAALAFFGHGVLGIKTKDSFVELVSGTYHEILGGTMSTSAASTIVNVIGVLDVALAAVMVAMVVTVLQGRAIALSTGALALFGWAMTWGFLTAASRVTAEMSLAQIWDFIERGPNFLLPAALAYLIHVNRTSARSAAAKTAAAKTGGMPAGGTPVPTA